MSDIGPVERWMLDQLDLAFSDADHDFARTHDAEDAAVRALAVRAFAALLELAIHDRLCTLCGNRFGHADDCLIPALCPHTNTHTIALIARTARVCDVCNKEIPQ